MVPKYIIIMYHYYTKIIIRMISVYDSKLLWKNPQFIIMRTIKPYALT